MNFTAIFLNHFDKRIHDEFGNPILTIKSEEEECSYNFSEPFLLHDLLMKRGELKTPEIKRINIEELGECGFVVCKTPISNNEKWKRWQKSKVMLCWKNDIPEGSRVITKDVSLTEGGHNTYIEYDTANKRIRVTGADVSQSGFGDWINIENV